MLFACLSLLLATTSCNNDELEFNDPQPSKQYTKAELIEQALSRKNRTRTASESESVNMVTIKNTVIIRCFAVEDMQIDWGDGSSLESIPRSNLSPHTHTYTDNMPSHHIGITGSDDAIKILFLDNNGLIMLYSNVQKNLIQLYCTNNNLDNIDLGNCPNLRQLHLSNNELAFVNILSLTDLYTLLVDHNQLKDLDVSGNVNLHVLDIGNNRIQKLDLTKNAILSSLNVSFNPITDLDLTQNTELSLISLEDLSINTINGAQISDTTFFAFPELRQLNIAYTPFCALDLSKNPLLYGLNISGTAIGTLDIWDLQMQYLYASRSELRYLTYQPSCFEELYELRIERTPFEDKKENIENLGNRLPAREGMTPGYIYSYSRDINILATELAKGKKNWVINPS
ncbi:MAG: hypothetical protein K2I90_00285 [Odoribacter sp.]|nr:hypothetical protein [Odoribacter sp.]